MQIFSKTEQCHKSTPMIEKMMKLMQVKCCFVCLKMIESKVNAVYRDGKAF